MSEKVVPVDGKLVVNCKHTIRRVGIVRLVLFGLAFGLWLILIILVASTNARYVLIAVFAPVAIYGIYLLIWYAWARMVRDPLMLSNASCCCSSKDFSGRDYWRVTSIKYLFMCLMSMALTSVAIEGALIGTEPNTYLVFSENLLGIIGVLLSSCWFADIFLFCSIVVSFFARKKFPPKKAWAKLRFVVTILLCFTLSIISIIEGYKTPSVSEFNLPLANLPACLDGFRLVMSSDVHVGPMVGRSFVQSHVQQLNSLRPDAIALVGDFTDGPVKDRLWGN
jgi:hypothetical protein